MKLLNFYILILACCWSNYCCAWTNSHSKRHSRNKPIPSISLKELRARLQNLQVDSQDETYKFNLKQNSRRIERKIKLDWVGWKISNNEHRILIDLKNCTDLEIRTAVLAKTIKMELHTSKVLPLIYYAGHKVNLLSIIKNIKPIFPIVYNAPQKPRKLDSSTVKNGTINRFYAFRNNAKNSFSSAFYTRENERANIPLENWLDPVFACWTTFDIVWPFLSWEKIKLEQKTRKKGRPAYQIKIFPNSTFKKALPQIEYVRLYLDAYFNALLAFEVYGQKDKLIRKFNVLSFKKLKNGVWTVKEVEIEQRLPELNKQRWCLGNYQGHYPAAKTLF